MYGSVSDSYCDIKELVTERTCNNQPCADWEVEDWSGVSVRYKLRGRLNVWIYEETLSLIATVISKNWLLRELVTINHVLTGRWKIGQG